jgi:type I restriction enzyme S subunit
VCEPQDAAIRRTEREINLLREYRTRLTADVVTGKFDVRQTADRLRPETEQPPADDLDEPDSEGESQEEDGP